MDIQPKRRRISPLAKGDAKLKLVATRPSRRPARRSVELPAAAPDPSYIRDSYSSTALAEIMDRAVHAATARFTVGLSPMMLISAYMDWAAHLGFSPGKRLQLTEKAIKKWIRLARYASRRAAGTDGLEPCIVPLPQDRRFKNSLVKYLTEQGYTVFMVSWKNPGPEDRDLSMEDYRKLGIMASLDVVSDIVPNAKVHGVGYCIGGTLLAIAAATMARDHDERIKSATFFATQTDFTEAGELMFFINESQLAFLEDVMWEQGFLDTKQMAGAFQMLRSNDLVWSRVIHDYLMGERRSMTDLMAWNADATRMPYRMHTQYLRQLFLANDLAEGRYQTDGQAIALTDIRVPIFAVGTEQDHVAPWWSIYKLHLLTDTDVTFLLTSSYNGVRLAGSLSKVTGEEVKVFLIGDAVFCAKGGQKVPEGFYNLQIMLSRVVRNGAEIAVRGTCMDARGIADTELIEGARKSTLAELTAWTQWADRVVVF